MIDTIAIYSNLPEVVVGQEPVYTVTIENGFNPVELIVNRTVIAVAGAGAPGKDGQPGSDGAGVPSGGETGQVLTKVSGDDYDTTWSDPVGVGGVSDHALLSNIGTNSHAQIDTALTRLAQTQGTNTGDQDLTALQAHVAVTNGNPHGVTKSHVGLGNVDNTSDANKPVSTAQADAIGTKQDTLVSGLNIKTINSLSVLGSGDMSVGGSAYDMFSALTGAEISITGAATATIGRMHVCSGTTADYTLTLPAATDNAGKFIGIRMSVALTKLVTIDGNGSETIDGALTRIMWAGESAILLCNGTSWTKVAGQSLPMVCSISNTTGNNVILPDITVVPVTLGVKNFASVDAMADTGNSRILIKRSGKYNMSVFATVTGNNSGTGQTAITDNVNVQVRLYIDGALWYFTSFFGAANATPAFTVPTVYFVDLAAGNALTLQIYRATFATTQTLYYLNGSGRQYIKIEEIISW